MKFILASASPRRSQILKNAGYEFDVIPSNAEEKIEKDRLPTYTATNLAFIKAKFVYDKYKMTTLGADTIVVIDNEILGKPKSKAESIAMLKRLSGRTHQVITGYAVIHGKTVINDCDISTVYFNDLDDDTINRYAELGLGMDKAGGYGIQDDFNLVKKVEGSFTNVVGLPIEKIDKILKNLGF